MGKLSHLKPENVFKYFEEISSIGRGSGNMDAISRYCTEFAQKNSLRYIIDDSKNVIIFKPASKGYENASPVILQGHLDMVCQKDNGCSIDFEKDGLDLYIDDSFIKAKGTTLGADNGIAVAYMLAILSDNSLCHPPLECVFTTDEEVGMLGALKLDTSVLKGRKMINVDGGGEKTVLVSCAGGADFSAAMPIKHKEVRGSRIDIILSGLAGGHSGTQINSGGRNANAFMARILKNVYAGQKFEIIELNGGDKTNVITTSCKVSVVTGNPENFEDELYKEFEKAEKLVIDGNPDIKLEIKRGNESDYSVMENGMDLICCIESLPDGVIAMSKDMEGLVETSANAGIVKTTENRAEVILSVRSSINSEMQRVLGDVSLISEKYGFTHSTSGMYPPWELKKDSPLQRLYGQCAKEVTGNMPKFCAVHAGLECGVFSSAIPSLDCISVGPNMYDIHSTSERLDINSASRVYEIISEVLKNCND